MDVMMFQGREGWNALSVNPSGGNLPMEHGPWTPVRMVRADGAEELANLRSRGFHLSRRKENDDA